MNPFVFKASNASVLAHIDLRQKKVGEGQGTKNRSYRNDATGINFEEFVFSLERTVFGHQK
ncbi:hypothetical protein HUU62_23860 [Rhodoferax sp. 4810]|nr:hypothetical protein [Rhodoferax jenense]